MRLTKTLLLIIFCLLFTVKPALSATNNLPRGLDRLLDTKAKLIANYSPMLALRGLANSKVYRKKGRAHLERYYYKAGSKSPYQKTLINLKVYSDKWRERIVEASGTINEHKLYYKNIMEFSFPKKGKMNIYCNLDDTYQFLSLYVESDGGDMTNKVLGYFAGKTVQYFTEHRLSEGVLAGSNYKMYIEGNKEEKTKLLQLKSNGFLDEVKISGYGKEIKKDEYEFTEQFGNIIVKSYLKVMVD